MKRLLITLALAGFLTGSPALAAPAAKPAPKSGAKAPAKKAAASSKKEDAIQAGAVALAQAERLDSCAALKASIGDIVSVDAVAGVVSRYLGELSSDTFRKQEFETTAEQDDRIHKILKAYVGDPDRVVFTMPVPRGKAHYDADKGELTAWLPFGHPIAYVPGGTDQTFLVLDEKEVDKGSVAGVTRMGVKFRYKQFYRLEQFVAVPEKALNGVDSLRLAMPRDEARTRIDNLWLVVLGAIQVPYVLYEDDEKVASLDSAYSQYTRTQAWYVAPRCVYLMDRKTKTVLGTFLEQPGG